MKHIFRLFIFTLLFFSVSSCYSVRKQTDQTILVTPLDDTVILRDGSIIYGLPRSVINITVSLIRTLEIPGPYAKYASDLLGLDRVIQTENESWDIESLTVNIHEELDPSEYFVIESNTLFQTNVLALKREGLILDLNPAAFYASDEKGDISHSDNNLFRTYDLGADEYFQLQRDTAYKRVNVDSSFIRIPYIVEKKKKLSADQLAEKAARRLMEMRDGKHLILTGEATVFPQNDAAIIEMNRLEKEYSELFTGKTITETRRYNVTFIPAKEMISKKITVFRYSSLTGVKNANPNDGNAVTIELTPEPKTKDITIINKPKTKSETSGYDKLYYRVPDVVSIKISAGNEILSDSRRLIYQFGQMVQLPANYLIGK